MLGHVPIADPVAVARWAVQLGVGAVLAVGTVALLCRRWPRPPTTPRRVWRVAVMAALSIVVTVWWAYVIYGVIILGLIGLLGAVTGNRNSGTRPRARPVPRVGQQGRPQAGPNASKPTRSHHEQNAPAHSGKGAAGLWAPPQPAAAEFPTCLSGPAATIDQRDHTQRRHDWDEFAHGRRPAP